MHFHRETRPRRNPNNVNLRSLFSCPFSPTIYVCQRATPTGYNFEPRTGYVATATTKTTTTTTRSSFFAFSAAGSLDGRRNESTRRTNTCPFLNLVQLITPKIIINASDYSTIPSWIRLAGAYSKVYYSAVRNSLAALCDKAYPVCRIYRNNIYKHPSINDPGVSKTRNFSPAPPIAYFFKQNH